MEKLQPQDWKIGTSYLPGSSIDLQEIKNAGLNSIEIVISRDEPDLTLQGLRNRFNPYIEKAHELGLEVWSIHLPFGIAWDISTIDNIKRQEIIDYHETWLAWVNEWGIKHVVIHPSYEPIPNEEREARIEACKYSLDRLAEMGRSLDIHICVEDLPRTCLGNTSQEMRALISRDEDLNVCCDVNHLLSETPVAFIKALGSRIRTVHISDYDGVDERHWMPGIGVIKWTKLIDELVKNGYEGPFMFEVKMDERNPDQLVTCWKALLDAYQNKE